MRTGRCLCGAVSYELSGDPIATAVCHCDHCQRQSGGAFSVNLIVHQSQLALQGEMSTYEERGEHNDDVTSVGISVPGDLDGKRLNDWISDLPRPRMPTTATFTRSEGAAFPGTAVMMVVVAAPRAARFSRRFNMAFGFLVGEVDC